MPTTFGVARPAAETAPDLSRREYVRGLRRAALWLTVLGLAMRLLHYALGAAVWGDEAGIALNVLNRDYEGLTHALDWAQVAPVLFLWAEKAVLLVAGTSEWALRFVPFLFGVAALLVFWDLARQVARPTAAALAVGSLAVSDWAVGMSATVKSYSGDLFWSALLMTLAVRWHNRPDRLWLLAVLAGVVPFALGLSFPAVFVAGAVAVYLLPAARRHPDRRALFLFAGYAVAMLASFAAVYALIARQHADPQTADLRAYMRAYWAPGFPPWEPVEFLWWVVKTHTGRLMAFPYGDTRFVSVVPFLLFSLGVWATWRSGNRALLVLCLMPFVLTFGAAAARQYPYGACTRISLHLAPAICLMVGVGWARLLEVLFPRLAARAVWVRNSLLLLAAFGVGQMVVAMRSPHHDSICGWSQAVGRELDRHVRPGDRILYRDCQGAYWPELLSARAPFEWYVARFGDRVSREGPVRVSADTQRVWLVITTAHRTAPKEEAELLAALGPGWVTVARAEYLHQPFPPAYNFLHCTVRCLARAPGPPLDQHPLLQSSP